MRCYWVALFLIKLNKDIENFERIHRKLKDLLKNWILVKRIIFQWVWLIIDSISHSIQSLKKKKNNSKIIIKNIYFKSKLLSSNFMCHVIIAKNVEIKCFCLSINTNSFHPIWSNEIIKFFFKLICHCINKSCIFNLIIKSN